MKLPRLFKNTKGKDVSKIKATGWLDKSKTYAIYMMTDYKVNRVARYFQDHGLAIYRASDKMEEISGEFILDTYPSILLFIDTGKGNYSSAAVQQGIVDMMGAADLDACKAVIAFYTDSDMKQRAVERIKDNNGIRWLKYNGSRDVLERMLSAGIKLDNHRQEYPEDYSKVHLKLEEIDDKEFPAMTSEKLAEVAKMSDLVGAVASGQQPSGVELIKSFNVKY